MLADCLAEGTENCTLEIASRQRSIECNPFLLRPLRLLGLGVSHLREPTAQQLILL